MFKKKILLGIFGTIICIGGMTLIPIASHKIKQLDTKDASIEAKIESKLRNLQNKYNPSNKNKEKIKTIENSPIITMISIEDAIQKGYAIAAALLVFMCTSIFTSLPHAQAA